jgi:DnaD/phage-associated family protein
MPFSGFPGGKVRLTPVPAPFFTELLPAIEHLGELKLILYMMWRLDRTEGSFRYALLAEILADQTFMHGLDPDPARAAALADEALERSVRDGALLRADLSSPQGPQTLVFLNSPRGRAALQAIQDGTWRPQETLRPPLDLSLEPPNLYQLYEENIGPLTPLIADALRDAESTYSAPWVEEAIESAARANKRNWHYIEAILRRRQEGGRHERQDRRHSEKDRRRYVEGEFSDSIEH